ncbi:MAG: PD40 domain-containing protein [Kiritimatiellae bacterium]|nr:PD40 domain-containing protein [Kiritimatiellia bacterium]
MKIQPFFVIAFVFGTVAVFSVRAENQVQKPNGEIPLQDRIYLGSRPSLSQDGKFFVFEWADSIWKASSEGGAATPLQTDRSKNSCPVLSPDGQKIAFCSDRDGGRKIFVMDIQGEHVRQLTFHSESTYPYAWIHGGRDLLIHTEIGVSPIDPLAGRIAEIPADRRAAPNVYFDNHGFDPSLSPDGKQLLFTRKGESIFRKGTHSSLARQLWLYSIDSKRFTCLLKRETESRSPIWTPDGKGFYYVSEADGCLNVWKYDLTEKKEIQITFFKDDSVMQPTLSGDGTTMIFRKGFDFYRIDPRSPVKEARKLILTARAAPRRPTTRRRFYTSLWNNDSTGSLSFSENGMQMAFTTGGDLYVMDTVVRIPHLVHGETRTHERECVFSKDGKALFYLSDRGDAVDIWKAERTDAKRQWWENFTFKKQRLTTDSWRRENLKLSPDGKQLSWQDSLGRIHICGLDGKETATGPAAARAENYMWSPDSKWIVASIGDCYGNKDIWIFPINGSREPYNLSRCYKSDINPCWSPDGKLIAFAGVRPDSELYNIFYVWLNPEDEAKEDLPKKFDDARKLVADNASAPHAKPATTNAPPQDKAEVATTNAPPQDKAEVAQQKKKEDDSTKGKKQEAAAAEKPKDLVIDFTDLDKRVRRLPIPGKLPYFASDSRALLYQNNGVTYRIRIPNKLKPEKLADTSGQIVGWLKKGDKPLWISGELPAHFTTKFPFQVYQTTDLSDYQELAFLTAWGKLRDQFYDDHFHGANWEAVKEKYRLAARYAPTYSVFTRVMLMMLGELNSSHLGFSPTPTYEKEWEKTPCFQSWTVTTAHLGVLFDTEHKGKGWRVRYVVPGGPADPSAANLKPGDIILEVDGHPVTSGQDESEVLNGYAQPIVTLTVQRKDTEPLKVKIRTSTYPEIRKLMKRAYSDELRERVHRISNNRLGYLDIAAMKMKDYYQFEEDIFAEGYGRDGMIIDVRNNSGGFVADRILQVLCCTTHSYAVFRGSTPGYLLRGYMAHPVWDKPIVVLCNETTASNGEIFSHAIKTMKRGKLVGEPTGARVIGTVDSTLLDYGKIRIPAHGWFLPDGKDMEKHGAIPDILIEDDLNQRAAGVDVQLNAAIRTLQEEVEKEKKAHPPVKLHYFK